MNITIDELNSEQISHPNHVTKVNTFINKSEIITIPADVNTSWKCIHDALITDNPRELFSADLIDSELGSSSDIVTINTNDNCMCELNLLNGQKILSIFDTGSSSVNLISADIVKCNEYLSTLPILKCGQFTIRNTSSTVVAEFY